MKPIVLDKVASSELAAYFTETWELQEKMYKTISQDALYVKYEPLRHPLIFYFGHTATFFINKMHLAGLCERVNPAYETAFAVGVDEMDWDDLDEAHYDFPSMKDLQAYRDLVKQVVLKWIKENHTDGQRVTWNSPSWIVVMGIEHEKVHIETSSVLIRTVELSKVKPNAALPICTNARSDIASVPQNSLVPVKGIDRDWPKQVSNTKAYGWDLEFGTKHLECKDFKASKFLVSNAEFFEFVKVGGYGKGEFWEEEGKHWLKSCRKNHPFFWVKTGQTFRYRAIFEEIEMPWDWPVDVNYHEAKAFCNWKAMTTKQPIRLPSEDEWFAMRDLLEEDIFTWKKGSKGNINLENWASACPIDKFGQTGGLHDLIGNVWQWTETPVYAFNDYQVHPLYEDFSSPTFDERHNLILGGSFISGGNLAMKEARYAFRRHFYQHAGFRYVSTVEPARKFPPHEYQTDDLSNNYLEFHFGPEYFGVRNFPKACIEYCFEMHEKHGKAWGKAADLGCAVGRSTFELARRFDSVVGIDLSVRFFQLGLKLLEKKVLKYDITREGRLRDKREIDMQKLELQGLKKKVDFKQQDVTILDLMKFHSYDLIFCGNLIDRMATPKIFLENIHKYLNKGGLLIFTSPYTWLPGWTKPENWVGGYEKADGTEMRTLDGIRECLGSRFRQVGEARDIPFVLRETARKYQHSLAQASCWQLL